MGNRYTFRVEWSEEDQLFIGRCLEFPSLGAHGDSPIKALKEIMAATDLAIEEMRSNGEEVPEPLSIRKFNGKILLRVPPAVHKDLTRESAEAGVSLNQLLVSKVMKEVS